MQSKLWIAILLSSIALLFYSCSRAPYLVLYNNSQFLLTVYVGKEIHKIDKNTSGEMIYPGIYKTMRIEIDNKVLQYDVVFPPREYADIGLTKDKIYCQFESDGLIYVFKSEKELPSNNFDFQPFGFPLKPK